MGGLVKAEFRKVFSTGLWWGLLIPVALLSFLAAWSGSALGAVRELEATVDAPLPLGLLTVSLSTNFCTVFAAIFGAMAMAGEYRHKSITTTYLTGAPRGAVLAAKLIAYSNIGLGYGLVTVLFASMGALLGAGLDGFGNPGDWAAVSAAGLLAMTLSTLLGVGLGALVTNPVLVVVVVLVYKFVAEPILSSFLLSTETSLGGYLPAASGNGIMGNLAVPLFVKAVAGADEANFPASGYELMHFFFGGAYGQPWWASVLTFVGYAALALVAGWQVGRRRDIT